MRAIVLQRDKQDHTMSADSTRGTDILIDQYKFDQGWQSNKNQNKAMELSRGSAAT